MKSALIAIGCAIFLAATVATAEPYSDYASLKEEDCRTLNTDEDMYQSDCASKNEYLLKVWGRELRYGATLVYGNHELSYEPIPHFNIGQTAEWRYNKVSNSNKHHSLIYRIYTIQIDPLDGDTFYLPREQDKQQLVVIRLNKEKSCLLGVIDPSKNMNQKARKRDHPRFCVTAI